MNGYERPTRRLHVYVVQESDEVVIHFNNPAWESTEMILTCKDGLVSIRGEIGNEKCINDVARYRLTELANIRLDQTANERRSE